MNRIRSLAVVLVLAAAGCKIEQTPPEYIDHRAPPAAERQASAEELRARLLAMGHALERRSRADALAALAPVADAAGFAPDDSQAFRGPPGLGNALERVTRQAQAVHVEDLEVTISPGNTVAWFRATLRVEDATEGERRLPLSGVFLREEGEWRLQQAHISAPTGTPISWRPPAAPGWVGRPAAAG